MQKFWLSFKHCFRTNWHLEKYILHLGVPFVLIGIYVLLTISKDSALKVKTSLRQQPLERNLEKPKYAVISPQKNRSLRENQAARLEGQADRKEKENDG